MIENYFIFYKIIYNLSFRVSLEITLKKDFFSNFIAPLSFIRIYAKDVVFHILLNF